MKKTRKYRQASSGFKQISFLPEPEFNPKLPSKNTLAFQALNLMLHGKKISHPDFENDTSSWRLAAHIHCLNKLGWPIQTIDVKHLTLKMPKTRFIHRYFLNKKFIQKYRNFCGGEHVK
jgi:hypothetical protein